MNNYSEVVKRGEVFAIWRDLGEEPKVVGVQGNLFFNKPKWRLVQYDDDKILVHDSETEEYYVLSYDKEEPINIIDDKTTDDKKIIELIMSKS